MDDFTLHSPVDKYIESNIVSYIQSALQQRTSTDSSFRPTVSMTLPLYDNHPPPEHPYLRASSSYSAVVQLYARSSQLDTAFTRYLRIGDIAPWCQFGCHRLETVHHIFVICPTFTSMRTSMLRELVDETSKLLGQRPFTRDHSLILDIARGLFSDGGNWPQHSSHFYFGTVPPLPTLDDHTFTDRHRLLTRISQIWHSMSIRLAGWIWGKYKRDTRLRN
ncbi:hypothetical protein EW146_g9017 [Bondarzewia mesenterica]|uniref:Reverse transcriptase zinc-binding domain-containing protein n=1 Tax=Bondarzewia mesenterica TaxID=1095465 RepID=A0A4S4L9L3_9AGAM|nr:hypothetical protein EW146_g9017 [Bondarzewia mesenterica]